jgi:hypothetical protein
MNTDRTLLNKARVLLGLEVKLEQMKLESFTWIRSKARADEAR